MLEHQEKVYSHVGKSFNFKSPQQVKDVLYGQPTEGVRKLGLKPVLKWSKEKREMSLTSDQYAFGQLTYENKDLAVLRDWSAYNRLVHRFNAFVIKLLRYAPCEFCTDNTKVGCKRCVGTRVGNILGHDSRYVTVKNGKWRFHPALLLLAISGRPISVDPNILQWPRNDSDWNIDCRDIVVAEENKMIVRYDLNKAELAVAGFLFDDPAMLDVVRMGGRAFSAIASEAFGIPEEQCTKGGSLYHTAKTATYAFIFFCQAQTLHETLAKQFVWIPVDDCAKMLKTLENRFARYRENVMSWTWRWVKERDPFYVVNHQGRRFVTAKSPEFEGHRDYHEFIFTKSRAKTDFFELCRKTASFLIQGSATGDNCQADGVYVIDMLDRLTKKDWSYNRFENGNWDLVAPLYLKYDELAVEAHKDFVDPAVKIFETEPGKYGYIESYLGRKRLEGLQLGTETTVEKQWDVKWPLPDNWQEMTKEKNSKLYYSSEGVRFKA